jgi:RNA polymerase sigma-70 factor, ECF subfamily
MGKTLHEIRDERLVLECQEGSRAAFEQLVDRWQDRLWRYARWMTGNDEAAADAVQETWMAIARGLGRLDTPSAFPAWAYRICSNRCADWVRSEQRNRRLSEGLADASPSEPGTSDPDPAADGQKAVRQAVARLAPDQRQVVALYYSDGLGVGEIALALAIPEGTVKSRLHYAREQLREWLEHRHD